MSRVKGLPGCEKLVPALKEFVCHNACKHQGACPLIGNKFGHAVGSGLQVCAPHLPEHVEACCRDASIVGQPCFLHVACRRTKSWVCQHQTPAWLSLMDTGRYYSRDSVGQSSAPTCLPCRIHSRQAASVDCLAGGSPPCAESNPNGSLTLR